ncbi:TlpA family protein disulfide reductase [Flavobacterium sp.]|uniref:TlpA family protein disulfide reductase n=1 Tax=Flavobacterium sp. TaxID=239 RepID=UPI0037C08653
MSSIQNNIKIIVLFFVISSCFAQKKQSNKSVTQQGYEITIKTENITNETLQLSFVYGTNKKSFVTDSIVIKNTNQKVVFKESKKIVGAIYRLALKSNPNNFLELALDNGSIINGTIANTNSKSWSIASNQLNKDFVAYQNAPKADVPALRNELIKKYPNSVLQIYLWAENKIGTQKSDDVKEQESFYTTFFDQVQPSEKRLAFLPNINKLLYKFVTAQQITNENYKKHIDKLLKGLDCKTQNFTIFTKYLVANIAFFESNNLEETYNHLYEKYIKDNTCKAFSDTDMNKYSNEFESNKKVPLLSIFPELTFSTKDSITTTIQEIYAKNDFTLVTFFSPTCQHCIDKMPEIKKFMDNLKEKYPIKNTQWVTILNDREENKWMEFLEKNQLEKSAINLKSLDQNRAYQYSLNAYSNPSYFLLNKEGKILLKSFNNKAILEIINK